MNRRDFLGAAALGAAAPSLAVAARDDGDSGPERPIIAAPSDPAQWPAFRAKLEAWRASTLERLGDVGSLYRQPAFAWAASSFSCAFVMLCDEAFYDRRRGEYTVDAFLNHGLREFGGYDSLVLWHAYPRIGVDDRNQFDFYRDMPGGLEGLRAAVAAIQMRGTRVYIDYNPWDVGTRREEKPDLDALVDLVQALQVDGVFLDTMDRGAEAFRAKLDAARPGVVLEGEGALPVERIHDHHASWAQHFEDSRAPGVLRNKWLERRHMQHQVHRWVFDHTGELHAAWMNGSGVMVWENVFGAWVGWSERDRSILRAMLPIQRRYAALFTGERWTPLVPSRQPGVYASLWEAPGTRLWTLVNRGEKSVEGAILEIETVAGQSLFDLVAGREATVQARAGRAVVEGAIPARGIGCVLAAAPHSLGNDFPTFLAAQAANHARMNLDATHPQRETRPASAAPTPRHRACPLGMVAVAPPATVELVTTMRVRECGFYDSTTPSPSGFGDVYRFNVREFHRRVPLGRYAIDEAPVTNVAFAAFLKASGYRPRHPENFLKHWAEGRPPAGKEDHPVVYVDLDDARAFARWAGKRLPTEEEWQFAAEGLDARRYPWGDALDAGRCNDGRTGGTTPVSAFPSGRSPCGCLDLCGNVWQWTESERTDGRTRFCIIRGGSFFAAKGSGWYADGGPRPANFAAKFLLAWPGLDRCATIGFRCAVDLE